MADLPPMEAMLREVFRVAYIYRQKYQHPTDDPTFWGAAAKELTEIVNQCKDHPFAQSIMLACYADIEREFKATKTGAKW